MRFCEVQGDLHVERGSSQDVCMPELRGGEQQLCQGVQHVARGTELRSGERQLHEIPSHQRVEHGSLSDTRGTEQRSTAAPCSGAASSSSARSKTITMWGTAASHMLAPLSATTASNRSAKSKSTDTWSTAASQMLRH